MAEAVHVQSALEAIGVDAKGVVERVFPGCFSLRTWRSLDARGATPTGLRVPGCARKLWRLTDLRRWAEWGFPSREDFEARLRAEGGQSVERGMVRPVEGGQR